MNRLWFYSLIKNKPRTFYGPTISIVGKAIEGAAPDGTVYGSASGVMQRDIPNFMKSIYTSPAGVFHISDYKARYYAIMRMGIARDVHCIVTANPSTLVEMQTNVNEFYDEYVKDIENGTLSDKFDIPGEIRAELLEHIKPNPARAKELRELKAKHGMVLPKHYWPNMQVVNTWMCGNTKVYFEKIKDSYPRDTVFHEFSYVASECKAGIVLKSNTLDTVMFPHKIYFEFIPESEIEKDNPVIVPIEQVKKGERYSLVVTTSSGFYRYNMNDLVEITGFHNTFPTISFIQKVNGIISLTGEKLHERQFINAVRAAEKETGRNTKFFIGFADLQNSLYHFYYEFQDQNTSQEAAEAFTKSVDRHMMEDNLEYESKRASNRIGEPKSYLLKPESFETFKARCIDLGYRDGQFKLNLLMQDEKRHAMFKDLVKG
jgi:hypothetical protein